LPGTLAGMEHAARFALTCVVDVATYLERFRATHLYGPRTTRSNDPAPVAKDNAAIMAVASRSLQPYLGVKLGPQEIAAINS